MAKIINDPEQDPRDTTVYNVSDGSSSGMVLGVIVAFVVLLGIGIWGLGWSPNSGSSTNITVSPPDVVQTAPAQQPEQPAAPQPAPQAPAPSGQGTGTSQ